MSWCQGRMSRRQVLARASAGLASLVSPAWAAKQPSSDKVEALLRQYRVPAVSLATFERGEIIVAAAYGEARARGNPATPQTRFQAASISKTANALCVMTLVRDGKLALDDPVNRHLFGW